MNNQLYTVWIYNVSQHLKFLGATTPSATILLGHSRHRIQCIASQLQNRDISSVDCIVFPCSRDALDLAHLVALLPFHKSLVPWLLLSTFSLSPWDSGSLWWLWHPTAVWYMALSSCCRNKSSVGGSEGQACLRWMPVHTLTYPDWSTDPLSRPSSGHTKWMRNVWLQAGTPQDLLSNQSDFFLFWKKLLVVS